eukprot:SAG11_NODE_612_length_8206_cov_4.251110_4_plen_70_part_00
MRKLVLEPAMAGGGAQVEKTEVEEDEYENIDVDESFLSGPVTCAAVFRALEEIDVRALKSPSTGSVQYL